MLRTERRLLAPVGFPIAATFRAGGYLATPKVRRALVAEHLKRTGSMRAAALLADWDAALAGFRQLVPVGVANPPAPVVLEPQPDTASESVPENA